MVSGAAGCGSLTADGEPRRRPSGGIADENESSPGTLVMRWPASVADSALSVMEELWRRKGGGAGNRSADRAEREELL